MRSDVSLKIHVCVLSLLERTVLPTESLFTHQINNFLSSISNQSGDKNASWGLIGLKLPKNYLLLFKSIVPSFQSTIGRIKQ